MTYPLSMTSFGRGSCEDELCKYLVEIRSFNHKYLDMRLRIPPQFKGLEEKVKKEITSFFNRGHIEVNISLQGREAFTTSINVNLSLASQYQQALQTLKKDLHLTADQDRLSLLASFPGVIETSEEDADLEAIWPSIRKAIQQALASCLEMRKKEGAHLKKDISSRLDTLEQTRKAIMDICPELNRKKAVKLKEKIAVIMEDSTIDEGRLAQEAAILAEKADITEELVRLQSHIQQLNSYLDGDGPVGRKLNFLLQEALREINTAASKIGDAGMVHQIVEMKNEVEKIREQIQNIE
ncbi:MAG: YicC/YloC family endoribonuclease [Thermodesulfobacteriota bacterium]